MSGIENSKEALLALVLLGKEISLAAKDGFDLQDLGSFISKLVLDEKFRGLLEDGVKGLDAIPEELKDLDAAEAISLIGLVVDAIRK